MLWPAIPLWQLQEPKGHQELLDIKARNNNVVLVNAFPMQVEEKYYAHINCLETS